MSKLTGCLTTLTFKTVPFPFDMVCFSTIVYHSIGQGISAVGAFFELLSQPSLSVQHPEENKQVAPAELCPILKRLYRILIKRFVFWECTVCLRSEDCSIFLLNIMLLFWYVLDFSKSAGSYQQETFSKPWGMKRWMILAKGLRWHKAMHSTAHLSSENHDPFSSVYY
jgi:hypothetical protein